jgi:hypothetical protein
MNNQALLACVLMIGLGLSLPAAQAQEETVVKAQQLLNALGFDAGIADGVIGPLTQQAITAYQRAQNLPATGELNEQTLSALGLLEAPLTPPTPTPPAPAPPPAAWRTVLIYLRYYDTQPERLLPYITERFRQGVGGQAWLHETRREVGEQQFSRLSWRIERVEPQDSDAASEATVEVYSRIRLAGEEKGLREVFALVSNAENEWLINGLQRLATSEIDSPAQELGKTTSER